jgi:prophage antirepressor-like protein
MSDLVPFKFESNEIRVIMDNQGKPWWVATDVCSVLGLSNPRESIKSLDEDERNTVRISDGIPGNPNVNVINESGLYSLIIRSNKPTAKKFRRWITHEVIPQLRKTGFYELQPFSLKTMTFIQTEADAAIRLAQSFGFKDNQALLSANIAIKSKYEIDCLELLGNVHLIADDNEIHLTPTHIGRELGGISGRKINKRIEVKGFQRPLKDPNGKIRGWEPTVDGLNYAVMKDTGKKHSDGTPVQQLFWKKSILAHLES